MATSVVESQGLFERFRKKMRYSLVIILEDASNYSNMCNNFCSKYLNFEYNNILTPIILIVQCFAVVVKIIPQ